MGENATMYLLLSIVAFDLYEGSILKATYERNKYEYLCQKPTQAYEISGRKCKYVPIAAFEWMKFYMIDTHIIPLLFLANILKATYNLKWPRVR